MEGEKAIHSLKHKTTLLDLEKYGLHHERTGCSIYDISSSVTAGVNSRTFLNGQKTGFFNDSLAVVAAAFATELFIPCTYTYQLKMHPYGQGEVDETRERIGHEFVK